MHPLVTFIRSELQRAADPEKAAGMQAYMKTDQPFYGVQTPRRKAIFREARRRFAIAGRGEYEEVVDELWRGAGREEMYQALEVAGGYREFHDERSWDLYEKLVHSATHWDTLDWLATRIVGPLVLGNRALEQKLVEWSESDNLWVRRASLLAHLKHKDRTNTRLLAETILRLAPETGFFIRKAIGWVLRDYAYTDPGWVARFVEVHHQALSGLSRREALKHIDRRPQAPPQRASFLK